MEKFKRLTADSARQGLLSEYRPKIAGTLLLLLCASFFGCTGGRQNNPILSASPSAAADDWIYFADSRGTVHVLQSDGKALWQYSLLDDLAKRQDGEAAGDLRIERLFARSERKLFGLAKVETGASTGHFILFALDANKLLWLKDVPPPEPNGSPAAIGDDAVYLAGNDGILYAYARGDGHLVWQYQVSQGKIGAPSVGADGVVYVTGARQNLHAIGMDGVQKWVVETKPQ